MNARTLKAKVKSVPQAACARLSITIAAILGAQSALALTPEPTPALTPDPCAQELCLAAVLQGSDGGVVCAGEKQNYSAIRSFDAFGAFDPISTAYERDVDLHDCGDFANELVKEHITAELGPLFSVP